MVWLIAGLVLVAVAWFVMKSRHAANTPALSGSPRRTPHKPAWGKCLTIPAGATACAEAHNIEGECFALGKEPKLPLAGCTHAIQCRCHLEPVDERRSHIEKRSGTERRPTLRFEPGKTDRRSGHDRREENANPFDGDGY